ncbi:2,3,4,5-tetrahydropyridine-2,6-dicarboxylate N-succinyltransferase [Mycobacteroides abscessus]|uniref:2,3,4,5-tetrahydropyridine-2,6-dicarboxylate N-succinyltransferase n=1 Tax=Mycobacteroides abscessus TaxID=36809 RepID=UPI000C2599A0|nr:2,3,4,5-tetrahydropyridine-2,6-dicarboxylate N-succinyltransferase [Mycobacteroides abscessus]RIT73906.1 2,3,4,5-tetrahydropyridine-2,6-dicarboxylate N-succinyltransferase [Mycobacteroides abscessus]
MDTLQHTIEDLWDNRDALDLRDKASTTAVYEAICLLDRGEVRIAEIREDEVHVNDWLKKAILLLFQQAELVATEVGPFTYIDKIPLKSDFAARGVRVVPGASARWGSYQAPGVVLMPSYVNIGAFVDTNTMVDTWATVGSCAQIGKNVHLSGGVGIGGVLEPPMASPVIIEDDVLIGSRAMITNGARVGTGSVIGSGVILNDSIPVIDAETGQEVSRGVVPPWTVTVFATRAREFTGGTYGLPCALIIKKLTPGERHNKAAINDVLRTHGIAL